MPLSERDFQSNVIELAQILGWRVAHFRPAQTKNGRWVTPMQGDAGFPDLVLAKAGRVIFAELKSEKGKATDEQVEWLSELLGEGWIGNPGYPYELGAMSHRVYVWRPVDLEEIAETLSADRGVA